MLGLKTSSLCICVLFFAENRAYKNPQTFQQLLSAQADAGDCYPDDVGWHAHVTGWGRVRRRARALGTTQILYGLCLAGSKQIDLTGLI
jgi:hypothetical protein